LADLDALISRIYKQAYSRSGTPWFWALSLFPAVAADSDTGHAGSSDGGL
jgi:hypothetical protein